MTTAIIFQSIPGTVEPTIVTRYITTIAAFTFSPNPFLRQYDWTEAQTVDTGNYCRVFERHTTNGRVMLER